VPQTETKRRAPAVKPDERREMLMRAVLPLVVEHGAAVTTARVAGIGEGTIFRAFADKDELLEALRPDSALELIAEIPLDQPLAWSKRPVRCLRTWNGWALFTLRCKPPELPVADSNGGVDCATDPTNGGLHADLLHPARLLSRLRLAAAQPG
jgi:AcrR family transcriptional regulator